MGLDMYLTGIINYEKTSKLEKEIEDLVTELNEVGSEVAKKFSTENKQYIDEFINKYKEYLKDNVKDKLVRKVIVTATEEMRNDDDIAFYIFNTFPITIIDLNKEKEKEILEDFKSLVDRLLLTDCDRGIQKIKTNLAKIEEKKNELGCHTRPIVYWRKANMIHSWFYRHFCINDKACLEGVYVDYDDLLKLRETCEEVVKLITDTVEDSYNFVLTEGEVFERVNELLPPMDGFFFGDTEINDNYLNKVKFTIKEINKIPEGVFDKFKYIANW